MPNFSQIDGMKWPTKVRKLQISAHKAFVPDIFLGMFQELAPLSLKYRPL